jgi:hypothetical protein
MSVCHLYKITNNITGEYYIGKHNGWTQRGYKNGFYWGSGIKLNNTYKKYGKENFKYEILCYGTTEYIFELERKYVTVDLVENDIKCLNLTIGGEGVGYHTKDSREKLRIARAKQVMPAGMYEKLSKIITGMKWMNNGEIGCRIKPENFQMYLNNGYVFGRLKNYINDEYREKIKMKTTNQWHKVKETGHLSKLKKV